MFYAQKIRGIFVMSKGKVDSKQLERLMAIMEKELVFFKNFLKGSREKTEFIVQRNTEELQNLTKEEENWILNLKELEEDREDCIREVAESLGIQDEFPLSDMISFLEDDKARELTQMKDQLSNLILEIKNINEVNANLLKNSLEYVDFLLNIVSQSSDVSDNSYGSGGKLAENSEKRRVMDFKL
jgi:flagellar biosynthesis/type III secretory pathway chaperone